MMPDERPDESTINDDNKFDKWNEDYSRKMQREAAQRSMTKIKDRPPQFEDLPTFTNTGS